MEELEERDWVLVGHAILVHMHMYVHQLGDLVRIPAGDRHRASVQSLPSCAFAEFGGWEDARVERVSCKVSCTATDD
jgi:hypothetical protein